MTTLFPSRTSMSAKALFETGSARAHSIGICDLKLHLYLIENVVLGSLEDVATACEGLEDDPPGLVHLLSHALLLA